MNDWNPCASSEQNQEDQDSNSKQQLQKSLELILSYKLKKPRTLQLHMA